MPGWLMPALKAILPHVGTIISATSPRFTRRNTDAERDQLALLQDQVMELQAAATTSDANMKELAREIKTTVELIETGAARADRRYRELIIVSASAIFLSLAALICAVYALIFV